MSNHLEGADDDNLMCLGACLGQGGATLDCWSNDTQAPFPWVSLFGLGIDVGYHVKAYGAYYPAIQ